MSESEKIALLAQLYEQYYKDACEYCLSKISHDNRLTSFVEDSVQEAFIKLMGKIDTLPPDITLSGWLCKAAWNKFRSRIRSGNKQERIIFENITEFYKDPLVVDNDIDEWVKTDAFWDKVDEICQSSSDIEEKVFNSYFVDDSSILETATDNNLSKNSVRSAIDRIRKRLRKKYKDDT